MSDLERLREWLKTYKGYSILNKFCVDYTDHIPAQGVVFPSGLVEIQRTVDILGNVTVKNQLNFALYYVFPFAKGDDVGASVNADWLMDFQRWVQEQSVRGVAPKFGSYDLNTEKISAQNGSLYENDEDTTALYMVALSVTFTLYFEL